MNSVQFRGSAPTLRKAMESRSAFRCRTNMKNVLLLIQRDKVDINQVKVWQSLYVIQSNVSGKYNLDCINDWMQIIEQNDLYAIERLAYSDTSYAEQMRKLSPLTVLLKDD